MLQFCGWGVFWVLAVLYNTEIVGIAQYGLLIADMSLVAVLGLLLTHFYRKLIKRLRWQQLGLAALLPRVLLSAALLALLIELPHGLLLLAMGKSAALSSVGWVLGDFLSIFPIVLFWVVIYFAAVFFRNYRNEEIKNLKMTATMKEVELNKIKSQLNPHFMFNSMNSIRALIDEDPQRAKQAVTQLSNILRTTLLLGKKRLIPFEEEWRLVRDYLGIESARYEERLRTNINIAPEASAFMVPPLLIQTLVENAIKHGISMLPNGGELEMECYAESDLLHIRLRNPGTLKKSNQPGTGFGVKNTRQRLEMLYGPRASLSLTEAQGVVTTEVVIPDTPLPAADYPETDS